MRAIRAKRTKEVKWLHSSLKVWWNGIPKNLVSKTLWRNYRRADSKHEFLAFVFVLEMGCAHDSKCTFVYRKQQKIHTVTGVQQSTFVAEICGCLFGYASVVMSSAWMAHGELLQPNIVNDAYTNIFWNDFRQSAQPAFVCVLCKLVEEFSWQ